MRDYENRACVRRYWQYSKFYMVKNSKLVIYDSMNIEKYIRDEYAGYKHKATFIAYGSDIVPSKLSDIEVNLIQRVYLQLMMLLTKEMCK